MRRSVCVLSSPQGVALQGARHAASGFGRIASHRPLAGADRALRSQRSAIYGASRKCVDRAAHGAAARPAVRVDLSECGTFVDRGTELWSFVPLPILTARLEPIVDTRKARRCRAREGDEAHPTQSASFLASAQALGTYLVSFADDGLILEDGRKHRAYFAGKKQRAHARSCGTVRRGAATGAKS